ncbi:Phage integrase [Methylobacterium oryzae CBMB20]|uniref:Phage integrase n=1 Tax=Methylobacterium oryzae CBMB20 TaxID=693986 RepID=A0A089NSQ3_9HYPH|nr:Phage integrase [Methylobacterium oryzae CBMB20]
MMHGISLEVIAEQLGHADTRVTKKHYAHLAPSYVAQAIRASFGDMGLVGENAVVSIGR